MTLTRYKQSLFWNTAAGRVQRQRIKAIAKEHRKQMSNPRLLSPSAGSVTWYDERKRREFIAICARYNNCCLACGSSGPLTRDHIRPAALNGSSKPDNIQPLCGPCNEKKYKRIVDYRLTPHPNCLT